MVDYVRQFSSAGPSCTVAAHSAAASASMLHHPGAKLVAIVPHVCTQQGMWCYIKHSASQVTGFAANLGKGAANYVMAHPTTVAIACLVSAVMILALILLMKKITHTPMYAKVKDKARRGVKFAVATTADSMMALKHKMQSDVAARAAIERSMPPDSTVAALLVNGNKSMSVGDQADARRAMDALSYVLARPS